METSNATQTGLIPDQIQVYINIALSVVLLPCLGLFGALTNLINIAVFVRQGFADCVSVCLVSLAVSDLAGCLMAVVYGLSFGVAMSGRYFFVDPNAVLYLATWVLVFCGDITIIVTAFISVERSLCVLLPFHFKDLITFKRAVWILVALYILVTASYMPIFVTMGSYTAIDSGVNKTRILLWLAFNRKDVEEYLNYYQNMGACFLCQAIVIASTIGMVVGLKRSNKFQAKKTYQGSGTGGDSIASKKNKAIIKLVSYLAMIFIICNSFRMCGVTIRRIEPRVDFQLQFHNVYENVALVCLFSMVLNGSVNIFLYCRFKPNFLNTLRHFDLCGKVEK